MAKPEGSLDTSEIGRIRIDEELCMGCKDCIPYCTSEAIKFDENEKVAYIDEDQCTNCWNCVRQNPCIFYEDKGYLAIKIPDDPDQMPQAHRLSMDLSNPLTEHPGTVMAGRGTEEVKTNEVTGRIDYGDVAIACELGRPGMATNFDEVEKLTKPLAELGYPFFVPENPVTEVMVDDETGELADWTKDSRSLSAIIEIAVPEDKARETLETIKKAADEELETTVTMSVMEKLKPGVQDEREGVDCLKICDELGLPVRPNGKNNLHLGRPLNSPLPFDPRLARAKDPEEVE